MAIAIILIGGSGTRMKNKISKQLLKLKGKPMFSYSLETFKNHPDIEHTILVTRSSEKELIDRYIKDNNLNKNVSTIIGGSTRQESCFNALDYLRNKIEDDEIILIHDGARPFITSSIITNNIEKAKKYGAVTTAAASNNSLAKVEKQKIISYENREQIWQIQTPQTFKYKEILMAHDNALKNKIFDCSDDAQLLLRNNNPLFIVLGSPLNFKITTEEDLTIANAILNIK